MTSFSLILVPYELGRLRNGVGKGPECLASAGAADALACNGATVTTSTIILPEQWNSSGYGEADAGFELMRLVAEAVRAARAEGMFPVILAGSCFNTVGVVAGLAEARPAVIWLDAHSDFSEPTTTESGYLDSMGLSILTGSAWQAMAQRIPGFTPVPEASVILAGARVFDPCEAQRLASSSIACVPAGLLTDPLALVRVLEAIKPEPTGVHLHIDLDVLDSAEAMVNVYSSPGGISGADLAKLVSTLLSHVPVRAVTFSVYDPMVDLASNVPPLVLDILKVIAGRV